MKAKTKHTTMSDEAQQWYDKLRKEYDIEDEAGLLLLQSAFEAFDRMRQAQQLIQEHGVIFLDRYQQPKPNPACAFERDQRSQMLQCLKALHLDLETLND